MYEFGKLFRYKYIDGDSSYIGSYIEYRDVILLVDFNEKYTKEMKIQSILFDTNTGKLLIYNESEEITTEFTINSVM